ncbi:MAG: metallophosphoesterase [Mogibacterium sp.]|nr:metallophosphoesterase [Mogibacterium sp.]
MKILLIADKEIPKLWEQWNETRAEELRDVGLILSAGDLDPDYLQFLVTMLNVPLLYVPGNHDSMYDERPPLGCVNIDGLVCELRVGKGRLVRVAGLGGSMRYRSGDNMYSEREMSLRAARLALRLKTGRYTDLDGRVRRRSRGRQEDEAGCVRILLTHAPSLGHGDLEDLPHRGFACFNRLIEKWQPDYHCYGHVHMEYGRIKRLSTHPSGTQLINANGMYLLEI